MPQTNIQKIIKATADYRPVKAAALLFQLSNFRLLSAIIVNAVSIVNKILIVDKDVITHVSRLHPLNASGKR